MNDSFPLLFDISALSSIFVSMNYRLKAGVIYLFIHLFWYGRPTCILSRDLADQEVFSLKNGNGETSIGHDEEMYRI